MRFSPSVNGAHNYTYLPGIWGFPGGSAGKESARNVGDLGLIPGLERSPGEGNSYPFQYSVLENSMDSIEMAKSARTGQLSVSVSFTGGSAVGSPGGEDPLEKEMATHCNILA